MSNALTDEQIFAIGRHWRDWTSANIKPFKFSDSNLLSFARAVLALAASPVPMASSAGEPCHNCGGLGYRREANGEQIPCDLCQDALEPVRARIEQAIREHCEGGDLWMVSHIAAKAITAPPAASLREQEAFGFDAQRLGRGKDGAS
jgi:hypothetical protein